MFSNGMMLQMQMLSELGSWYGTHQGRIALCYDKTLSIPCYATISTGLKSYPGELFLSPKRFSKRIKQPCGLYDTHTHTPVVKVLS